MFKQEAGQVWVSPKQLGDSCFGWGARARSTAAVAALALDGFAVWDPAHPVQLVIATDAGGQPIFKDDGAPKIAIKDGEHRTSVAKLKKFPWITCIVSFCFSICFLCFVCARFVLCFTPQGY